MSETDPSPHLQEESQDERGPAGSRDEGGPPDAGPTDRPTGKSHTESDSGVNPLGPTDPAMPNLPTGDGGH